MIVIDIRKRIFKIDKPSNEINQKTLISSANSIWFGDSCLLIVGGSLPPLGNGGRCIFMYTNNNIEVAKCDADICVANEGGRMVGCDKCDAWLHICCDASIKGKKKLPEKYFCPQCSTKGRNTRLID